jgi:hypothetical protein
MKVKILFLFVSDFRKDLALFFIPLLREKAGLHWLRAYIIPAVLRQDRVRNIYKMDTHQQKRHGQPRRYGLTAAPLFLTVPEAFILPLRGSPAAERR